MIEVSLGELGELESEIDSDVDIGEPISGGESGDLEEEYDADTSGEDE